VTRHHIEIILLSSRVTRKCTSNAFRPPFFHHNARSFSTAMRTTPAAGRPPKRLRGGCYIIMAWHMKVTIFTSVVGWEEGQVR